MKRKYLLSFLLACFCCGMIYAQTPAQAKQWLGEGNYEQATPAYKKLVKQVPSNANYNYGYGRCCYENGQWAEAVTYLKKAADRNVTDACYYLAEANAQLYRFEDAEEAMEKCISLKNKKKEDTTQQEARLAQLKQASMMLKGTEQITFVDSLVVDKENFLSAYRIGAESGTLAPFQEVFQTEQVSESVVYQTELKNRRIFALPTNGKLRLHTQDLLGDRWGEAEELAGLESEGDQNYPYVLSDGTTLYYADNGENSLGGYDIFVTRYNSETNRYLRPENLGMPFNSPANDYMYVVDEFNNLGWFATDRNQPADKVCIYLFIPNKTRQTYNYEDCEESTICNAARIYRIADTQTDLETVVEAKHRLASISLEEEQTAQANELQFVINDQLTYHSVNDFKSVQAKRLFAEWQESSKGYRLLTEQLEERRTRYHLGNEAVRQALAPEILDMERQAEKMERDVNELEINVRNAENSALAK